MLAEAKLKELGIELPEIPTAGGNYLHAVLSGNLLYLSGKVDRNVVGKVGAEVSLDEAYAAARQIGLFQLAVIRQELGSLDRVKRVVKVLGMVNTAPDFAKTPAVINGFSDLMLEVFGDLGRHARSAVGMATLPNHVTVEIEAIVEVHLE
ncbi:MAG: enamine deaminase RidA (YjgF/YER057c/UK114 family) [Cellvibrionaceae bacterium]|jgi:enamine deaminase RidA (YjgF/YER057c/UK114 family)